MISKHLAERTVQVSAKLHQMRNSRLNSPALKTGFWRLPSKPSRFYYLHRGLISKALAKEITRVELIQWAWSVSKWKIILLAAKLLQVRSKRKEIEIWRHKCKKICKTRKWHLQSSKITLLSKFNLFSMNKLCKIKRNNWIIANKLKSTTKVISQLKKILMRTTLKMNWKKIKSRLIELSIMAMPLLQLIHLI